ncbi:E3 ubiquitin-protein ligase RNF186-like [Amia ocellicauda]|uniref:E3 ubiquitin-protein ligase RNF186-like n=1 Tax=Amia ocellicauda TaxID=2972642 RepID=UPI003463EC96
MQTQTLDVPPPDPQAAECPVCLCVFEQVGWRQPKQLCCGHSFCGLCLSVLLGGAGLCCPLCRRVCPVPGGIIALLPDPPGLLEQRERWIEGVGQEDTERGIEGVEGEREDGGERGTEGGGDRGEEAVADGNTLASRRLLLLLFLFLLLILLLLLAGLPPPALPALAALALLSALVILLLLLHTLRHCQADTQPSTQLDTLP